MGCRSAQCVKREKERAHTRVLCLLDWRHCDSIAIENQGSLFFSSSLRRNGAHHNDAINSYGDAGLRVKPDYPSVG